MAVFAGYSCASAQLSPERKGLLIQQLEAAKKQDEDGANDSTTDPAEVWDSLQQMHKADRAIRELQNGFTVPEAEIKDALEVPPRTFSKQQIAEIIQKLKHARKEIEKDDQTATELDDLVGSDFYEEHEEEVDNVIKDLEIGEDVPWSTIKHAMTVPQNL